MAQSAVKYTKFSDKLTDSLNDINRMIKDNRDMIDAIQEVALSLTDAMGTLHTLTVKYAGIANSILDALLPIVRNLPVVPKKVTNLLVNLEAMTQKIIDDSKTTAKTIKAVNSGLRTGDVNKLKGHTAELKKVSTTLTRILPKK